MFDVMLKKDVEIRDASLSDVAYLKSRLRQGDVDELFASNGLTPTEALTYSYYLSKVCLTIVKDDPVGMFGIVEDPSNEERAIIWMLGTDKLYDVARRVLKDTKEFIGGFLDSYNILWNHIDARNTKAIKWLKHLGAEVDDAVPFGKQNLLFHKFVFRRDIVHA